MLNEGGVRGVEQRQLENWKIGELEIFMISASLDGPGVMKANSRINRAIYRDLGRKDMNRQSPGLSDFQGYSAKTLSR